MGRTNTPRMPYGMAKQIVASLALGDSARVRPEWLVPCHNAARRMGLRIRSNSVRKSGQLLFIITRIDWRAKDGRAFMETPTHNPATGQWQRKAA